MHAPQNYGSKPSYILPSLGSKENKENSGDINQYKYKTVNTNIPNPNNVSKNLENRGMKWNRPYTQINIEGSKCISKTKVNPTEEKVTPKDTSPVRAAAKTDFVFKKPEGRSNKRANPYSGNLQPNPKKEKLEIQKSLLEAVEEAIVSITPINAILIDQEPKIEYLCYVKDGLKKTYNRIDGKVDGLVRIENNQTVLTACFEDGIQMTPYRQFSKNKSQ